MESKVKITRANIKSGNNVNFIRGRTQPIHHLIQFLNEASNSKYKILGTPDIKKPKETQKD